jgi:hypothetical protein
MAGMAESGSAKNAFYALGQGLHGAARFAIVRAPSRNGQHSKGCRKRDRMCRKRHETKEVDDERETLHNLSSLLLTNKTIRRTQQGSTEYKFFNNKQSISVGV